MRLLVVEDESIIAQDLTWVIENRLSFSVAGTAATASEALAVIAAQKLDGAVLDANLEDGTSETVAAELQRRRIPYFVLSGSVAQNALPSPLDRGPLLSKPYREKDLVSQLAHLAETAPGFTTDLEVAAQA